MYGQQNPYAQQFYRPFQQTTLSGRMVTSREEALGVPADFTNGCTFMPDLSHGRIFAKIFNPNTGEAPMKEFRLVEVEAEQQFATHQDFVQLRSRLEELEALMKGAEVK